MCPTAVLSFLMNAADVHLGQQAPRRSLDSAWSDDWSPKLAQSDLDSARHCFTACELLCCEVRSTSATWLSHYENQGNSDSISSGSMPAALRSGSIVWDIGISLCGHWEPPLGADKAQCCLISCKPQRCQSGEM